ncbi:MAG: hypothetical protein ABSD79_01920 [Dehalococcoidales bacterium]
MAKTAEKVKVKATPVQIGNLMVVNAWAKTYSTGSTGFFGQAIDGAGVKYTITAVKNGSKPSKN